MGKLESIMDVLTTFARKAIGDDSPLSKSLAFIYVFENPIDFDANKINPSYFDQWFKGILNIAHEDEIYQYSMCLKLAATDLFGAHLYDSNTNSFVEDDYLRIKPEARTIIIHRARKYFYVIRRIKEDKLEKTLNKHLDEICFGIMDQLDHKDYLNDSNKAIINAAYSYVIKTLNPDNISPLKNSALVSYRQYQEYKTKSIEMIGKEVTQKNLTFIAQEAFKANLSILELKKAVVLATRILEYASVEFTDQFFYQNFHARVTAGMVKLGKQMEDQSYVKGYINKVFESNDPNTMFRQAGFILENNI